MVLAATVALAFALLGSLQSAQTADPHSGWCRFDDLTPPGQPAFGSAIPAATSVTFTWRTPNQIGSAVVTDSSIHVTTVDDVPVTELLVTAHASAGEPYSETVGGLTPDTTYEVTLRARSILGCYSAFSEVETVTTAAPSVS
jgi:hypothetical protein